MQERHYGDCEIPVLVFFSVHTISTAWYLKCFRSTAFGIQTGIARIAAILGNIIFGVLVDVHCAVPMILVAALMSFGGLMSVQLPNTKGIDIH